MTTRLLTYAGLAVVGAMLLCPPWTETRLLAKGVPTVRTAVGYHWVFSPPIDDKRYSGYEIDFGRLALQVAPVALVGLLLRQKLKV